MFLSTVIADAGLICGGASDSPAHGATSERERGWGLCLMGNWGGGGACLLRLMWLCSKVIIVGGKLEPRLYRPHKRL